MDEEAIRQWAAKMDELCKDSTPEDEAVLQEAIDQIRAEGKEQARREAGEQPSFPLTYRECFENPPVLVEVRFWGTSPDWYLLHEVQEFVELAGKFKRNVQLRLTSVWDLEPCRRPFLIHGFGENE